MICPYIRGDTTKWCSLNTDHSELQAELDVMRAVAKRLHDGWQVERYGDHTYWYLESGMDDVGDSIGGEEPMTPAERQAVDELNTFMSDAHFPTEGDDAEKGTSDG